MIKEKWNKYCGDRDLYEKYSTVDVFNGSKKIGRYKILAIYRYLDGVAINTDKGGSYPVCSKIENNKVVAFNHKNKFVLKLK